MQVKLSDFIDKASILVETIVRESRFLMVDHDFNINVNRAFDDLKLFSHL
jgi:hypothetical protein